jgi:hypothetical protein
MLNIFNKFISRKTLSVKNLIKVKKLNQTQYTAEAHNGLLADIDIRDDYMFVTIKDKSSSSTMNYCTHINDASIDIHTFILNQLADNVFFQFDKKTFPYLRNRYAGIFTNHPNVLTMFLGGMEEDTNKSPAIHYFNDIYYPEVIIVKKTVIKNINKITFCLLSSTKKHVQRAHFYKVNDQLFEVGRFSDFSSIFCIKDKMNEYSRLIDTRKVRILKHNYNACLLIKEGLKYKLIVEDFIDLDNDNKNDRKLKDPELNKFFEFTYEEGVIKQNSRVFDENDFEQYKQNFIKVYNQRLKYCRAYYPSIQTYETLRKMNMDESLPLSDDTLLLLSMYEI